MSVLVQTFLMKGLGLRPFSPAFYGLDETLREIFSDVCQTSSDQANQMEKP